MSADVYGNLRKDLRRVMRDEYAIQWTDADLDEIIQEGQREHALYSESHIGEQRIEATESGVVKLPSDFISVEKVYRTDGTEIPVVSWRRLATDYGDFRKMASDRVEAVCFDYDTAGCMRLFPRVPANMVVGKMVYRRYANETDATGDMTGVRWHCLFQMAFLSAKETLANFWAGFMRESNRVRRSASALANRVKTHGARWF